MITLGASCRNCGEKALHSILDMGQTPLANSLLKREELDGPEPMSPLELAFCTRCSLVQITESVAPEKMFREYLYLSSFSETMLHHSEAIARRLIAGRSLSGNSLVVEVASNDGYLLQFYRQGGIPVLGIEPAINIATVARERRGIPTLCEFFTESLARKLRQEGCLADVIHANNVLAHVPDLNGFVEGVKLLLKENGVAVLEVPYVKDLIDHCEFDTIYHEHLCYFSFTVLDRLFQRHGLLIQDVERLSIHGGSLRVTAIREKMGVRRSPAAHRMLEEESSWGVDRRSFYEEFGASVDRLRVRLVSLLRELKAQGRRIAVYGASAKGSTLLNYFGIGREILDYVVDRSTVKQGWYTPGTHLQIFEPEKLLADQPDYVLLLAWNFADEILGQQIEYRRRGGRFIVPIPEVRVL